MPLTGFGRAPHTSSWTPASLPNLVAWYDASNAGSITQSGGFASQINDLSGNGYHLTQGTGASQPATGANTINGLNVLTFDNVDDNMAANTVPFTPPYSIFLVFRFASLDTSKRHDTFYAQGAGGNAPVLFVENGTSNWDFYNGGGTTFAADTSAHSYSIIGASSGSGIYQDGSNKGTPGAGLSGSGGFTFGSHPANGYLAEMFVSSSAAGSTDQASAESYLRAKWGTP